MGSLTGEEKPPQVSLEQQSSSELIKRVRKLRWMGMEDEAQALQGRSGALATPTACSQTHMTPTRGTLSNVSSPRSVSRQSPR